MKTVFRLVKHDRMPAVQNIVGYFLPAVRRQAMHYDNIPFRFIDKRMVDLEIPESDLPF
jgi:hypothetical protein